MLRLRRLRRLCQDDNDFREQCLRMRDFFVSCGYPLEVLDDACNRVSKISRTDALIPRPEQSSRRTKLIMTYHPHNLVARKIVLNNLSILQADPDAREVFDEPPLVVYRRAKNIRDMLVRSRISASHDSGTRPCRRPRCKTCTYVSQSSEINTPRGVFTIADSFTCTSRNLIYAIVCKRCDMVYIGETGPNLATRFSEHLRDVQNGVHKPVSLHFRSSGHQGCTDMEVLGLPSSRGGAKSRFDCEQRLIFELGTLAPEGMNVQHIFPRK
ncbi:hypothetical protein ElyMa_004081700 [Elysia marginata]|uniref:GIY-YIG domain-containing protein n=1 Tax=Elysia marginata TaxID=1093978 RepID=A0AAV4G8A9_9GAST|nr:hypothetical protein ElyMa_004081700 [Elysia marginata]